MLADIQRRFVEALRDDRIAAPADVVAFSGNPPIRRFDIYRDNVAIGLSRALASRFPASVSIVGEDFFLAMAREFAAISPPRSPVLIDYGDALPAFAETFEPAREVPYLSDVLRLEVARAHAYHAADRAPLDASALAALTPDRIAQTRVTLHPSVGLVRSVHPIVTIWSMTAAS